MINMLKLKFPKFLIAIFLINLFVSCGSIKPTTPEITVGIYTPPIQEVSTFSIPVEMEMKSYFKEADNAVPFEFKGKEQNCEDVSYDYKFIRNPIKIQGKGGNSNTLEIGIGIEGKYALNLNYCPKCSDLFSSTPNCLTPRIYASCGVGEPMRRITVDYTTKINLQNDFTLKSKTKLEDVIPKDKCQITVFRYNATEKLVKEVKGALSDLSGIIDKEIESLEIKKEIESIWKTINEPNKIENYGYLNFNPNKIGVEKLSMIGTNLKFNVLVEAYPQVTLVQLPMIDKPLPNLSKVKDNEGFNLNLDLIANYDSLSVILNRELSGKIIEIKKNKIRLEKASIYGAANQQLSIEVDFSGSKSGKLYFLGTPKFIDSIQEISFPDLSFELQTKNALLKSAKWMFSDLITRKMRELTRFSMSKILEESRKKIELELNKQIDNNIYLSGKMNQVKVKSIFPDRENLIIQTNLIGNLNVYIK
jgi:hypothetical protein